MKRILSVLAWIFLLVIPITLAAQTETIDLDVKVIRYNNTVSVEIEGEDDNDFKNISCSSANTSFTDNFNDIKIEITTAQTEISDLTKQIINHCSVLNFTERYATCESEKGIAIGVKESYKDKFLSAEQERDKFKNESQDFRLLYENESSIKGQAEGKYNTCNTDLLSKNTEYNRCYDELQVTKKKPTTYAIVSIIITIIAVTMYFKGQQPKPPEFGQFPER